MWLLSGISLSSISGSTVLLVHKHLNSNTNTHKLMYSFKKKKKEEKGGYIGALFLLSLASARWGPG